MNRSQMGRVLVLTAVLTAVWSAALVWTAVLGGESATSCLERDLPDWEVSVDYRRALASETLAPDRVTIDGRMINTNLTETAVEKGLGKDYRIVEDWLQRDAEQHCAYLASLARAHSNSMHYYISGRRQVQTARGFFPRPGMGRT